MTDRPNILLITIDCLRSDHVTCYGYPRNTTPNIDRLAKEGVLYKKCIATSCWTLPSMASLMTGLFPSTHGAHDEHQYLDSKWQTLPSILGKNGYKTAAIVTVPWLNDSFGMDRGFEYFCELKEKKWMRRFYQIEELKRFRWFNNSRLAYSVRCRDASRLNKVFGSILSELIRSDAPFFIHCHYFDCHPPFLAPKAFIEQFVSHDIDAVQFNKEFKVILREFMRGKKEALTDDIRQTLIDLYDSTISYVDRWVGDLIGMLQKSNALNNTMAFLTADHGILFGEHGFLDHNFNLYNGVLDVPLILFYPDIIAKGQVIEGLVQHTDILPSLMNFLKIECPGKQGDVHIIPHNSRCVCDSMLNDRLAFSELFVNTERQKSYGILPEKRLKAIQNLEYKYLQSSSGEKELYCLTKDPHETKNLLGSELCLAKTLERELIQHERSFFHWATEENGDEYAHMSQEVKTRLEDLGYL